MQKGQGLAVPALFACVANQAALIEQFSLEKKGYFTQLKRVPQ